MVDSACNWMIATFDSLYFWISTVTMYLYSSYCLYKTALNCGEKEIAAWAFWPVAQFVLMLKIARMPRWHILVFLVPGVNMVAFAVVWVRIAQYCGLSTAWGVVSIIPIINIFAMGKIAACKPRPSFFAFPSPITHSKTPQSVG